MRIPAAFRRGYLGHIVSVRFVLTLIILFAADAWLEGTLVVQRAVLGGFDTLRGRSGVDSSTHTVIVGISSADRAKHFNGQRPVPPSALQKVVGDLIRLRPRVLVVDIFTYDSAYRTSLFSESAILGAPKQLVWAQFVDTATGEALPFLGGVKNAPGRPGLAAMIADEDHLVRRFRPRFAANRIGAGSDTIIESLPLAAATAYIQQTPGSKLTPRLPRDTSSIVLRTYDRNPPFYFLDDVLSMGLYKPKNLSNAIVVLGFVDESDQVSTPSGTRPGPEVVADAIESLLDERGAIQALPKWLEWVVKIALALVIAFIHYKLPVRLAAISMIGVATLVIFAAFLIYEHLGYWTSFILILVGVWVEQLYDNVMHSHAKA